jgi:hypothetical protein
VIHPLYRDIPLREALEGDLAGPMLSLLVLPDRAIELALEQEAAGILSMLDPEKTSSLGDSHIAVALRGDDPGELTLAFDLELNV